MCECGCIGKGRTVWLYPHNSSSQGSTHQCRKRPPWTMISHLGNVRAWEWALKIPQTSEMQPERLISSSPHPENWVKSCTTWGREDAGRVAGGTEGMWIQKLFNAIVHHQEAQPRATGEGLTVILPNLPMGTPSALCNSPTHPLVCGPWCGQLLVHTLKGRKNKLWLMASKHCRKAARICRPGSNHKFEL